MGFWLTMMTAVRKADREIADRLSTQIYQGVAAANWDPDFGQAFPGIASCGLRWDNAPRSRKDHVNRVFRESVRYNELLEVAHCRNLDDDVLYILRYFAFKYSTAKVVMQVVIPSRKLQVLVRFFGANHAQRRPTGSSLKHRPWGYTSATA